MIAGGIALVVAVLVLGPAAAVVALLASAAGAALLAALAHRQIGGQTGDVLGATQQIAEICFLFAAVALAQ
jgi:adenosylcobinamide-GDP ribazoletransferase